MTGLTRSLHTTPDGALSSASRSASFGPACVSSGVRCHRLVMNESEELEILMEASRDQISGLAGKANKDNDLVLKGMLVKHQTDIIVYASRLADISTGRLVNLTRRLVYLTWALVGLTVALLVFTA